MVVVVMVMKACVCVLRWYRACMHCQYWFIGGGCVDDALFERQSIIAAAAAAQAGSSVALLAS